MRRVIRRGLRAAGRFLLGTDEPDLITRLIRQDARADTFFRAIEYVNYERVPGDLVECGVFGGLSLAVIAKGATFDAKGMARRIAGIDSFEGLPASAEVHARWETGDCALVHAWHPLAAPGEPVSADTTYQLFEQCGLERPLLHVGRFDQVLPTVVPSVHPAIALLHVDCDLYESTRDVLAGVAPALQDGTIVLFDDWYHYRASPRRGEARAFHEFLAAHQEWEAVRWRSYGTFCNAFMLVRR
ncbi:MAG: TylF/MycF/NovP-related O-methyltransferase [Vicinamibacterales bacterium]